MDGTLIDSYPALHESLNDMLRALHLPEVDLQTVKRRVGRGLENLVRQSVPERLVQQGIELFKSSYERTYPGGTFLLPGVRETLAALKSHGIKMAVASNKPAEFTGDILGHLDLERFFDEWTGPDVSQQPKPHPSMLRALMHRMHVAPDETFYVGDMPLDAETASAAGVGLVLVASGGFSLEELEKVPADYILSSMNELVTVLEGF